VGFIDRRFRPRITAGYICGKRSAHLCAIAAWRVDSFAFFSVHRAWIALSQLNALLPARPGNTIPSISPMCAQAWRRFTQVIHMVMHSTARNTFSCRAVRQRVSVPVLARGGRPAGRRSGLGHRPRRRAPDARRIPCGQVARVPRRLPAVTLIVILPAARPRYAHAARAQPPPALAPRPVPARPRAGAGGAGPHRRPGSAADHRPGNGRCRAAGPRSRPCSPRRGTQSCGLALRRSCTGLLPARRLSRLPPAARRGRPGTSSVPGRAPDHRGRHPRGCRGAGPARRSRRAESGTAPPCMRWRGRARPRRADWPVAWSSPRAARRPPGPGTRARGRSPGSSRVPGVAPGWCPFPAVKALLLPPQAPRKALRPAISCCSAIHGRLHRKQAVIRISHRLSTGLLTVCPQAAECQPENTTTAGAECPVLSSQLAT
jgi:hypothetical protein